MRLIDADALKSKIREQPWKQETKVYLMLDWIYMLIDEASTVQIEALQQQIEKSKWISVTEKLPDNGTTVLAYIKHSYSDTDGWRAYRVFDYTDRWIGVGHFYEVIAWMPIPKPPSKEE